LEMRTQRNTFQWVLRNKSFTPLVRGAKSVLL
jgi:hypothetical protein